MKAVAPPRHGLAVELCGLPGSGKTTVAAAVASILPGLGVTCTISDHGISAAVPVLPRVLRRTGNAALTMVTHPRPAAAGAVALRRSDQRQRSDAARLAVQWLGLQRIVRQSRRQPGFHLLEEGFAQTVWSAALRARASEPSCLWGTLPGAVLTDLIVLVDVAPAVAFERLAGRASRHSRTQLLADDEALTELRAGAALLEDVVARAPMRVVRVRGEGAASTTATQIVQAVLDPASLRKRS